MVKVSVIIPAYRAEDTIGRAVWSLLDTPRRSEIEIIVVDDCSPDSSCDVIKNLQKSYSNIRLFRMTQNSGGPSAPRNLGIEKATGKYITFLDADDWFDAERLMSMVDYAIINDADFLKGYLITVNGNKQTVCNRIYQKPKTTREVIESIMSYQSTTNDLLISKEVLISNNIRYGIDLKIGEDTVFTADILAHCKNVCYIDEFFLYYNIGSIDITNVSSTHRCDDKEINDQITAWERTQEILKKISLDYYELRVHIGIRNVLISIVRYSEGIIEETYKRLHDFILQTQNYVKGKMNLHSRYQELYDSILSGDYKQYCNIAKTRLLIAGYDLKFILPVIPYLSDNYNVRIDEWTGHATHDEKLSKECAGWADIIFCEWMLQNAVFYTKHKNSNQRLVIRAHRFEITRDCGHQIDFSKVDMVVAVGYYYFEQFIQRFSIPRYKMRLLLNYVEDSLYTTSKTAESIYSIGIIGILPARKGFYRGLEIIKELRKCDNRFKLYVMGNKPQDVPWIINNPSEAAYFKKCEQYIIDHNMIDAVIYGGFIERENLYKDIGFVLSLSDEELPESFHLAPAEGACAGSMSLLLKWPGVEYIYPKNVIYNSINDITKQILKTNQDAELYDSEVSELRDYVIKYFGMDSFLRKLKRYLKQLYVLE